MSVTRTLRSHLNSHFRLKSMSASLLTCMIVIAGCSSGSSNSGSSAPSTTAPSITTQPAAATANAGATASFTAAASGNPTPTYQWWKGGTAIAGATSASYTTPALAAADNGSTFTVTASNSAGSVTSSPATLTVDFAPSITTQPAAASAFIGATASFTVAASGNPTPTYQWSKGGVAISGATSATYTTPTLAAADSGSSFTVTATNSVGSVTSSAAALTVTAQPASITTQPADSTITDGGTATFSVVAAGTGPITYQWSKNGVAIAGANSATYTYTPAFTDSGATFTVSVSNSAATVASRAAKLTINAAPINITTQPTAITMFAGETDTFTVAATGTNPTYQWRKNSAAISGATSATYTTPALAAADDKATFDVLVSNSTGTVDSTVITLRVGPFATNYTTQKGVALSMFAWPGAKNAFLTKTAALDGPTMRKIVVAADGTWNYYAGADGTLPSYYFTYTGAGANGTLATIANTGVGGVDLCGDGCTFIGATGMEVSDNAFGWLYNGVLSNTGYDQVMFYEFGRSFWLFGNQLQYQSPADSSCEVTGFAVLMRYRSLSAQGYTGLFGGSAANYTSQYTNSLGMIDTYAGNASLNFNNTFLTNSFSSPYGGCSDLWASMVIRLANNYGGEAFIQDLFKEALKRPTATTTQTAIDNFVLAASAAANKNLTLTFGTTWKWPISTSAQNEAQTRWGNPQ